MAETKNDFMLLAVHTDREFTCWLQRHAEEGWWLKENRGNTFVFSKKPWDGTRVCSYTLSSPALGVSAEDTFYELQDVLRKNGWALLTMGMPENFTDKTRHAFLYELPHEGLPAPEIPQSDPEGQSALLRGALKKALSTAALCLIFAGVLVYFILSRSGQLFANIPDTVLLILMAVLIPLCLFYSGKAALLYAKAVRDPETDTTVKGPHDLDRSVILSSVMLGILALYLIVSFLI